MLLFHFLILIIIMMDREHVSWVISAKVFRIDYMCTCRILTSLMYGCSILVEQTLVGLLGAHSMLLVMIMMLQLMNMVGETEAK